MAYGDFESVIFKNGIISDRYCNQNMYPPIDTT